MQVTTITTTYCSALQCQQMNHFLRSQPRGVGAGVRVTALWCRHLGFLSSKAPLPVYTSHLVLVTSQSHPGTTRHYFWTPKKGKNKGRKKPCHVNLLFLLTGKTKALSESISSPFLFTPPALVLGLKAIGRPVPDTGQWDHSDWFRLSHRISWGWRRDPLSVRSRCCHMLLNQQIHHNYMALGWTLHPNWSWDSGELRLESRPLEPSCFWTFWRFDSSKCLNSIICLNIYPIYSLFSLSWLKDCFCYSTPKGLHYRRI